MSKLLKKDLGYDIKTPGYCQEKDIWGFHKSFFDSYADFIKIRGRCVDIGVKNAKMEYIKDELLLNVGYLSVKDFNFDKLTGSYDTIFCFETLEHIQNPLFFMREMKSMLRDDGTIYLSLPGRAKIFWTKHHFREYNKKDLQKWILIPLGLEIIRSRRIRIPKKYISYFKGIRPLLRIFVDFTNLYEIKCTGTAERKDSATHRRIGKVHNSTHTHDRIKG
jgi:SAM-dependent methyltransferase